MHYTYTQRLLCGKIKVESKAELTFIEHQCIERIVCSGGGAKGVVYPGAYQALYESGVMNQVKDIAGSSAGAITSALMAAGIEPIAMREALLTTNMTNLLGERVGTYIPLMNESGEIGITRDGIPLEQFIRMHFVTAIKRSLDRIRTVNGQPTAPLSLVELIRKIEASPMPYITFRDLALLHKHFPEHFKTLAVTAVKFPNGKLQIFNAKLTPDVEVALACRASSSIPVLLKPVKIDINGQIQEFIDGGLYVNIPLNYFDFDEKLGFINNQKPTQTMVFAFGEGFDQDKNPVFQALHSPRWDETIADDIIEDLENIIELNILFLLKEHYPKNKSPYDISEKLKQIAAKLREGLQVNLTAGKISQSESNFIFFRFFQTIFELMDQHDVNEPSPSHRHLLGLFKSSLRPVLYQPSIADRIIRDKLLGLLGDLNAPYLDTVQNEMGYQEIRSNYALRTVELRVGAITTTDFNEATQASRIMDALGYLDTMNYILNHDLHSQLRIDPDAFYGDILDTTRYLYDAELSDNSSLPHEIQAFKTRFTEDPAAVRNRHLFYLIKEKVEKALNSPLAIALSRAIEFHNGMINTEHLLKETYIKAFELAPPLRSESFNNETFIRAAALKKAVESTHLLQSINSHTLTESPLLNKVRLTLEKIKGFSAGAHHEPASRSVGL